MANIDYAELLRNGIRIYSIVLAQLCVKVAQEGGLRNYADYGLDGWTLEDQVAAMSYLSEVNARELESPDEEKANPQYWLDGQGKFNESRLAEEEAKLVEVVKAARAK